MFTEAAFAGKLLAPAPANTHHSRVAPRVRLDAGDCCGARALAAAWFAGAAKERRQIDMVAACTPRCPKLGARRISQSRVQPSITHESFGFLHVESFSFSKTEDF
jgi:hypothetical protein